MSTLVEVSAPSNDVLHTLLQTLMIRLMKLLTRRGVLVESMGQPCAAKPDAGQGGARKLWPPRAAVHRIGHGRKRFEQLRRCITRRAHPDKPVQCSAARQVESTLRML